MTERCRPPQRLRSKPTIVLAVGITSQLQTALYTWIQTKHGEAMERAEDGVAGGTAQ